MSASRQDRAHENFERALARLEEAIGLPRDDPNHRDVVILRFLLVYETAWKALRHHLVVEGLEARYAKQTFREAFRAGWIEDEVLWLKMVEDRNLVAHTYDEATAQRIRDDVDRYLPLFRALRLGLSRRAAGDQD